MPRMHLALRGRGGECPTAHDSSISQKTPTLQPSSSGRGIHYTNLLVARFMIIGCPWGKKRWGPSLNLQLDMQMRLRGVSICLPFCQTPRTSSFGVNQGVDEGGCKSRPGVLSLLNARAKRDSRASCLRKYACER